MPLIFTVNNGYQSDGNPLEYRSGSLPLDNDRNCCVLAPKTTLISLYPAADICQLHFTNGIIFERHPEQVANSLQGFQVYKPPRLSS